jgi:hypothetical protein
MSGRSSSSSVAAPPEARLDEACVLKDGRSAEVRKRLTCEATNTVKRLSIDIFLSPHHPYHLIAFHLIIDFLPAPLFIIHDIVLRAG